MDFFQQLQVFSARVFGLLGFYESTSPWKSGGFRGGAPSGAILHFTAGSDIRRTLRWFMQGRRNARASAHVVVADGWPEDWVALAEDLDQIRVLPAAVVQCVPPHLRAWHATWTNPFCYGIEMVNAGELRPLGGGEFAWWPDDWARPWRAMGSVPKVPVEMYGRYWESYTCEQILSVVQVLRNVQAKYGSMVPNMVLGHEQVVEHKWDPGPLFPIHGVRQAVFDPGSDPMEGLWFKYFAMDVRGAAWRAEIAADYWFQVVGRVVSNDEAWEAVSGVLRSEFLKPRSKFGDLGRMAMGILGYHADYRAVWDDGPPIMVFQRMMGLREDGIPGPITRRAIVSRLEDRGILG